MSQSKQKKTDKRPVEQLSRRLSARQRQSGSKPVDRERKGRLRGRIIIISLVIIVVAAVIGVPFYLNYQAPFNRPIIKVGDASISMRYFIKRARLATGTQDQISSTIQGLTDELLIKQGAPRYGIEASPEDIDQELRRIARGGSETISESEFKEWYRQQLNESRLSNSEYRDLIYTGLLAAHLYGYLAERVPTVTEHVHLHAIVVNTYEDAEKIRARWEAGEDFADLAREFSLAEESKETGGDLGWIPLGASDIADYAASSLELGAVSEPLMLTEEFYHLLMVSEKADAREVDEDYLPALWDRAFKDWLTAESQLQEVSWHGLNNGYDSETQYWIGWQLQKQ